MSSECPSLLAYRCISPHSHAQLVDAACLTLTNVDRIRTCAPKAEKVAEEVAGSAAAGVTKGYEGTSTANSLFTIGETYNASGVTT